LELYLQGSNCKSLLADYHNTIHFHHIFHFHNSLLRPEQFRAQDSVFHKPMKLLLHFLSTLQDSLLGSIDNFPLPHHCFLHLDLDLGRLHTHYTALFFHYCLRNSMHSPFVFVSKKWPIR
jgi:hypothetical protein